MKDLNWFAIENVKTAARRAQQWKNPVGQEFLVMAMVVGFEIEPFNAFAKGMEDLWWWDLR